MYLTLGDSDLLRQCYSFPRLFLAGVCNLKNWHRNLCSEWKGNVRYKTVLVVLVFVTAYPSSAWAYVDPGLVSLLLQGGLVAIAGFTAAYIVAPWRWIKSFFQRNQTDEETDSTEKNPSSDNKGSD